MASGIGGREPSSWSERLTGSLLATKGIAIEGDSVVKQNSRLQAWPWTEGTFSWIEPTAYCLLALKKRGASGAVASVRMTEAEAVILDRVCESGGWNYGNSQVLSQDLRPYVPTTALALLAMQDRRGNPAIEKSLQWLKAHATSESSTMALALTAICLQAFREPTDPVVSLLGEQDAKTGFLDNAHLMALALYAFGLPTHQNRAFVL
jgi:hypothetical protein